jgi:transposase
MSKKKALQSPTLKAKVALAALKGDRTISQVAAAFQVHPNQICKWRRQLPDLAPTLFESAHDSQDTAQAAYLGGKGNGSPMHKVAGNRVQHRGATLPLWSGNLPGVAHTSFHGVRYP